MALPSDLKPAPVVSSPGSEAELIAQILSAEADFERGDYLDITPEQLARAIATGESPWPDESLD